jgi:hypothetical protein
MAKFNRHPRAFEKQKEGIEAPALKGLNGKEWCEKEKKKGCHLLMRRQTFTIYDIKVTTINTHLHMRS